MKIANVLVAEQSIPNSKNGSWTQRLEYFLKTDINNINYVICGKSKTKINSSTEFYYLNNKKSRIVNKFFPKKRYANYLLKINTLLKNYDHIVLCVVDNIKLLNAISDFVDKKRLTDKITILFYNCGYSYFLNQKEHTKFSKNIDEFIFLTKSAYLYNLKMYSEFTPEVSIINNPINKEIFNSEEISTLDNEISKKYNLKDKKIYLWLSHDRKKKGMSLILNAWKSWENKDDNSVLLIVGAKRNITIKNIFFIGEVSSKSVIKYYKLAHVFLFPTLWKEGFGLSLSQAICAGCFSIAANNGGVSDFFKEKHGILINEPNIVENWVTAMKIASEQIDKGWKPEKNNDEILSFDEWSDKFSHIFTKWQKRIKI